MSELYWDNADCKPLETSYSLNVISKTKQCGDLHEFSGCTVVYDEDLFAWKVIKGKHWLLLSNRTESKRMAIERLVNTGYVHVVDKQTKLFNKYAQIIVQSENGKTQCIQSLDLESFKRALKEYSQWKQ